jgi:hypothetical protein
MFDDPLTFQFAIGFGNGVAVDAELFRQGADARKRLPRSKSPTGCGHPDLIHNLEVSCLAGVEIKFEEHRVALLFR